MHDFLISVQPKSGNRPPKVVIFESANPEFFIMHRDVNGIHPPLVEWKRDAIATYISITRLLQNITTTVFIAEVNGRAFGAGAEVTTQMDMRFAGPSADVGFFENGFGLMPGGGGQQFLATLINKARALQYILGCEQIDGRTGAEIGWFNEFYEDPSALTTAVDHLAYRISMFPDGSINATKAGLNWMNPSIPVLENDIAEFIELDMRPDRARLIEKFLRLSHNQSRSSMEFAVPRNMIKLFDDEESLTVQEL
ncbi:Nn.00g101570.m01.CDS01 [Neocucurbitaria sp. VM-36]